MVYAPLLRWAGFTSFFAAVLVFLCLLGFIVAKRGPFIFLQEGDSAAVLLALWLSIPVILPLIVSYLWFPVFGEIRYALYITIPYYLLISVGIAYFHKSVRIMLIILLVMSNTLFLKQYYSVEKRADLKRVYGYIGKNIKEGETAAFITGNFKALAMLEYGLLKYYAGVPTIRIKIPQTFNDITTNRIPTIRIPKYESEIRLIQEYAPEELDYKGIWLIMWTPPGRVAVHQDIINDIKKKYGLTESISAKLSSSIAVTLHHFSIKQ